MPNNADELDRLLKFSFSLVGRSEYPLQFGVTGSRGFTDLSVVSFAIGAVGMFHHDAIMHNGGAGGADALCLEVWQHYGANTFIHAPRLEIYGSPRAYHVRNQEIVDRADLLLAFKRGETNGTLGTIKKAEEREIPVFVFNQDL